MFGASRLTSRESTFARGDWDLRKPSRHRLLPSDGRTGVPSGVRSGPVSCPFVACVLPAPLHYQLCADCAQRLTRRESLIIDRPRVEQFHLTPLNTSDKKRSSNLDLMDPSSSTKHAVSFSRDESDSDDQSQLEEESGRVAKKSKQDGNRKAINRVNRKYSTMADASELIQMLRGMCEW